MSPTLAGGFLTTVPPGKPPKNFLFTPGKFVFLFLDICLQVIRAAESFLEGNLVRPDLFPSSWRKDFEHELDWPWYTPSSIVNTPDF